MPKNSTYNNNKIWTNTFNNDNFDIAMGYFHGAEVSDLKGVYILNDISSIIGLYRDDDLGIVKQLFKSSLK